MEYLKISFKRQSLVEVDGGMPLPNTPPAQPDTKGGWIAESFQEQTLVESTHI